MCVYFDRQAIEKLQTELGTVKADIERALRENEKYQPTSEHGAVGTKLKSKTDRKKWRPLTFDQCMMRCPLCG